ncbi:pantothenate kinase [Cryptococcus floricola]|uniref:Pantothenate kinase n=1 Tax=Cryptococcus floricola TaxID=2591691 RepID=A0A5D3AU22_9TREE|nr:pantothenate kinase [Cryptococcus floricola]
MPAQSPMPDISIPQARRIVVDTTGAQIVQEESPATRDSRGIYLPHYTEPVSHIAIDIGGSLAKVVYFTRSNQPLSTSPPSSGTTSPFLPPSQSVAQPAPLVNGEGSSHSPTDSPALNPHTHAPLDPSPPEQRRPTLNGALTPATLAENDGKIALPKSKRKARKAHERHSSTAPLPGGLLNFARFETENIEELITFLQELISSSATANRVSLEKMKQNVKVMATGGGAHMYHDVLTEQLGVEVHREEEMECLIRGLGFVTRVPEEVFWFSEELVYKVSHLSTNADNEVETTESLTIPPSELPRPSPTPPAYQVTFAPTPAEDDPMPHFPCLMVNIGSGVSIVKVDEDGKHERVSGTSLEMLMLSEKGDNSAVDMLVGDIYGQDANIFGLKSSTIASTFGKVFKKGSNADRKKRFKPEDIAKSLLYAISNNIGHVAYMNAAKYGLDKVFFGGCFIRGHAATISTLSYAIRFWSKGTMTACFLRHEGFLGAIGAWIKNVGETDERGSPVSRVRERSTSTDGLNEKTNGTAPGAKGEEQQV